MMNTKRKIVASIGAAILSAGLVLGTTAPASAAWDNTLVNSVNRCTQYVPEPWSTGSYRTMCGAAAQTTGVRYVRIPAGQCVGLGYWSFTYYCAPSNSVRYVYLGSGTYFVR